MKTLFGMILVAVASLTFAQEEGKLKRPVHKAAPPVSSAPVTQAEADATFVRVAGLFKTVLHVSVTPKKSHGKPGAPVSRAEVITEFVRLYKAAEPVFTQTPATVPIDMARLTFDTSASKPGLVMLVERGCVGNYGPLATGKKPMISITDFGDSLGYFLSRLAECTHVPSSKWTPYLHD